MPEIAKAALVSEATAYRYFPDLASLLREAIAGQLPAAAEALQPVADSDDPVERIAAATEFLLRHVLARQGVVRALIAATITRPGEATVRPGLRFGLIDQALAPLAGTLGASDPAALTQLKRDLADRRQRRSAVQPARPVRAGPRGRRHQHRAHRDDPHQRRVAVTSLRAGTLRSATPAVPSGLR